MNFDREPTGCPIFKVLIHQLGYFVDYVVLHHSGIHGTSEQSVATR